MADIVITPDFKEFEAALARIQDRQKKIADLTEKYGPLAGKAWSQVERAAIQAAKGPSVFQQAMEANTRALTDLRGQINQGAEGLGKLGAAAAAVDPDLGALFMDLQKGTGILSAATSGTALLGAAFAPLGVALAGLAAGYLLYKNRAEEAAEAQKKAREEAEASAKVYVDLGKATANASIDAQVLAGQLTEVEAAQAKAAIATGEQFGPALEKASDKMRDLRKQMKDAEEAGYDTSDATEEERQTYVDLSTQLGQSEKDYDNLELAVRTLTDAQANNIQTTANQKTAHDRLKDSLKAEADEAAFLAGVNENLIRLDGQLADVERDVQQQNADTYAAYRADLEAAGDAREKMILGDIDQTDAWAKKQKEAAKQVSDALTDGWSDVSSALNAYLSQSIDQHADTISTIQDQIKDAQDTGDEAKEKSLKKQLAAEEHAAEKAWEAQQALSLANATVDYAEALVKATTYGPIGGPIVAGAATVAYGASVATINSQQPSFSDQPPTRVTSSTRDQYGARYASNDTVHAYRDPLVGIQQVVQDAVTRSLPQPPATTRRTRVGPQLASTPVSRLLTRDVERATRGRITT